MKGEIGARYSKQNRSLRARRHWTPARTHSLHRLEGHGVRLSQTHKTRGMTEWATSQQSNSPHAFEGHGVRRQQRLHLHSIAQPLAHPPQLPLLPIAPRQ